VFGLKGQDSFTLLEAYLEPVKNACPPQQIKSVKGDVALQAQFVTSDH